MLNERLFLPTPIAFIYKQHLHVTVVETKDGASSRSLDVAQPHNIYASKTPLIYSIQSVVDQLVRYPVL